MELQLFDTYSRSVRKFEPQHPPAVGLYTCGPTVYDYAHIGNLRTYIFEDFLRRVLDWNHFQVTHVMNITDVGHLVSDADEGEDKMEKGSARTGKSAWEIAEFYTKAFQNDMDRLNILLPTIWCRATDHIQDQIEAILCIESKGFTYQTSDGIYFDTSKQPDYGYLGRLDVEGLRAGMRIDMGEKRNPTDFALWKFSPTDKQRQMEWDSPWGKGFPGWHIECSAMSAKYLGAYFDIHCGGEDHITVHHTNEIAQTEACHDTRLANFWMHGYFLQLGDEKMAKSGGGFIRLETLIERGYDPLVYRFFCLNALYRVKLNFTWEAIDAAATSLERLRKAVNEWQPASSSEVDPGFIGQFEIAINDDLNMPRAVAVTWDLVRSNLDPGIKKSTIAMFDQVLGLKLMEWEPLVEEVSDEVLRLMEQRTQARKEKRWTDADAIRGQITALGYDVEDTPLGPKIKTRK
ncbi:MAG: cysteine--tRNA ligase [Anaerolinea sp.]|nr:cysteine--tRNA ligase [Anaerolinea sp.]